MRALATSKPDPFVGREVELDELADQLTRMLSGRPAVTLLTGEAGVGKSRLLRELAVQGRHLGAELTARRATEQPVVVRIGLNLGRVLPEEDRLFGAALIQAVRICARAQGGQILLSESVSRALTHEAHVQLTALGRVPLKGFEAPAELFALANVSPWS